MKTGRHSGRLASHAIGLARQAMRRPPPAGGGYGGPREPWSDRSAQSLDLDGNEWAVVVDWAERPDGTRVPASVTLSSLGGTLTDDPAAGVEPVAVTATLLRSINWADVFKRSRENLSTHLPASWRGEQYAAPSPKSTHDDMLRLVARIYRDVTRDKNPTPAKDVHARLEVLGAHPIGGGPLSRETVRRWIKEARRKYPDDFGPPRAGDK